MKSSLRSTMFRFVGMLGLAMAAPLMAQADGLPPYAKADEILHGTVTTFDGHFHLEVRDDRGFLDDITLHQGTVINPLGLTLAQGMTVTVMGSTKHHTFLANEIDTPYHTVYPYPVVVPVYGYGPYPPSTTVIIREHHHWH